MKVDGEKVLYQKIGVTIRELALSLLSKNVGERIQSISRYQEGAEKLYYYYCRENSVTNQSFSERWFDSLYFADRIYEELKGRNNLEVFARYQLLIAYYTVLRRMYPFRNQYKKEYQLVIDKIKSTSFKSVLSYMDKKQVFGVLSIKYCILLYKFMRCVSKWLSWKNVLQRECILYEKSIC